MEKKTESTMTIVKEAIHDVAENIKETAGEKAADIKEAIADKAETI